MLTGSYLPQRLEDRAISFLMIAFQRNDFQVLEKHIPELWEIHTPLRRKEECLQL